MRRAGFREEDVHDVVQETMLAFVTAFRDGQYDREKGTLRSWLHFCALRRGNGTQKETQEIAEARWFTIEELAKDDSKIVHGHLPLFLALTNYLASK